MTYNRVQFDQILSTIFLRFDEKGKNWRAVMKALLLLEYLVKGGSEDVAKFALERIYAINTLKSFNYVDPKTQTDHGLSIRTRAGKLTELLQDKDLYNDEREKAKRNKDKFHGSGPSAVGSGSYAQSPGGSRYGGFSSQDARKERAPTPIEAPKEDEETSLHHPNNDTVKVDLFAAATSDNYSDTMQAPRPPSRGSADDPFSPIPDAEHTPPPVNLFDEVLARDPSPQVDPFSTPDIFSSPSPATAAPAPQADPFAKAEDPFSSPATADPFAVPATQDPFSAPQSSDIFAPAPTHTQTTTFSTPPVTASPMPDFFSPSPAHSSPQPTAHPLLPAFSGPTFTPSPQPSYSPALSDPLAGLFIQQPTTATPSPPMNPAAPQTDIFPFLAPSPPAQAQSPQVMKTTASPPSQPSDNHCGYGGPNYNVSFVM
eukprot:TRINITY_DN1986_c0_g1_i1.p1 TRINITY_DN1986_c0_g1~~TRINITY_DN1986_c0_g1_i1.p1  ORF type:complete len:454 (-),score=81.80 TRINITY_DN1986_c0_g1_i1:28-1311(-)